MAAHIVPVPTLEVDFRIPDDGTPTLICRGRICAETCGLLKLEVKKWVARSRLVIVDLGKVTYIDSSGLGTLLASYISAKSAGCDLKLINLTQRIKDLLHLTRLASVFERHGDSV